MKGIIKGYDRLPPMMKGYERCSKMLRIWRKNSLKRVLHGLVDPLFGSSWQEWHRYKLHRGIELDPWVKEWPPSWVYDLTHGRRRGLF